MVKHPLAKYTLGAREPAWIKIKPGAYDFGLTLSGKL